jgi:hypothetical protein
LAFKLSQVWDTWAALLEKQICRTFRSRQRPRTGLMPSWSSHW